MIYVGIRTAFAVRIPVFLLQCLTGSPTRARSPEKQFGEEKEVSKKDPRAAVWLHGGRSRF